MLRRCKNCGAECIDHFCDRACDDQWRLANWGAARVAEYAKEQEEARKAQEARRAAELRRQKK